MLLRAAAPEHYTYYHLLSGSDLPLKSPEQIHTFFETYAGKEFIAFDPDFPAPKNVVERISLWHFFRESRFPLAEPADHVLTLIQRLFRVNRLKNCDFQIRKGPNWFSISDNFVQYVLEHEDWIRTHFSHSVCADELFLQTLSFHSPFRAPSLRRKRADRLDGESAVRGLGAGDGEQPLYVPGGRSGNAAGAAAFVCTEV